MSNDFGGLIKSLKTMADDYNAIAKWAATSPEEEWRQSQRDQPDPGPPYGVPPYIVVKLGWGMNERHYDRVAKMLYERRAKAPEFTKYLLRPFPPWLTEADITFVGPDANMDVSGLARRAVDVQIALEKEVDFPNNLTPEQLASLVDTPTRVRMLSQLDRRRTYLPLGQPSCANRNASYRFQNWAVGERNKYSLSASELGYCR